MIQPSSRPDSGRTYSFTDYLISFGILLLSRGRTRGALQFVGARRDRRHPRPPGPPPMADHAPLGDDGRSLIRRAKVRGGRRAESAARGGDFRAAPEKGARLFRAKPAGRKCPLRSRQARPERDVCRARARSPGERRDTGHVGAEETQTNGDYLYSGGNVRSRVTGRCCGDHSIRSDQNWDGTLKTDR
jgi:hypothetical protein